MSAPGGFGKTTLLSAWEPAGYLVIWLSLDDADDDLRTFVRKMVDAVHLQAPDALDTTRSLLDVADFPAPAVLAARLADELAESPGRFMIVLDDYHTIHDDRIHTFLTRFVTRIASNVHLVISTREDPPLSIATLRARAEVAEVRLDRLAFTTEEVHTFFGKTLPSILSAEDADRLAERMEGWAAGIRLASLAMADALPSTGFTVDVEARGLRHAREFIIDDILAAQPAPLQELLLSSSILERFCAPLLDALVDETVSVVRGEQCLETLQRANLFITVLDADGSWCRFHQLFRDALQRQVLARKGIDSVASLHRRASTWFAGQGLVDEAIRHALAAGDGRQAALLIEENFHPLLDREGDSSHLESWIRLLPADVADRDPAVLLARAWLARYRGRPGDLPELLRGAETLLDEDTSRDAALREALRGTADSLWAYAWSVQSEGERMLARTERAIVRIPSRWRAVRGDAEFMHAMALSIVGRDQEAREFLEACRASATPSDGVRTSMGLRAEARLHYLNLRNRELMRTAAALLKIAQTGHLVLTFTTGHLGAGLASYVSNDLVDARDHFQAGLAGRGHAPIGASVDSALGLAVTQQALGEADQARTVLLELAVLLKDMGTDGPLRHLRSCQARLALAHGDLDEAGRQLRMIRNDDSMVYPSLVEVPAITRARWLLLQGLSSSLEEVATIADGLRHQASIRGHTLGVLRADLVQALLLQARGDTDGALPFLKAAVALARPGDVLRHFIDFGPPMRSLLRELERWTSPSDPYLARILAAFPTSTGPLVSGAPARREGEAPLIEALTWRELDILRLLDARMANKEIASVLHISSHTVNQHAKNIYQKLQVGGRREAVSRAHSLGLLPIAREPTS